MNYRHAFHAGNFADVHKHIVLTRIIEYLQRKDRAFRVIDTHAGAGLYDLHAAEASRTGEWVDGVGRLLSVSPPAPIAGLLAPFLDAVAAANGGAQGPGQVRIYPGSPFVARHLLRKQDRLSAIELHPQEYARLKALFEGDIQVRVIELDGWLALGAHLPPKEKRGLVLVDPPFELEGEFSRLVQGLQSAVGRWPGGVYALWYPIKDQNAVDAFRAALKAIRIPKMMDLWLTVCGQQPEPRLIGSGMVIVNPPYSLEVEMRTLMPWLCSTLQRDERATWRVEWIAGEAARS